MPHMCSVSPPQNLGFGNSCLFFSFGKGWNKALSEGDSVGQAHKRIALRRFAASRSRGFREIPVDEGAMRRA
jgi:hypothetical protein